MTVAFTTLAGPVTEPDKICDELLLAVFASDYSQSNAFLGHVKSFQFLVHRAGDNFRTLATATESMFKELFSLHFAIATVNVGVRAMESDPGKITVSLSATLTTDTGQVLDLASQVIAADGKALEILVGDRQLWKV